jgi:hypothetical protein
MARIVNNGTHVALLTQSKQLHDSATDEAGCSGHEDAAAPAGDVARPRV